MEALLSLIRSTFGTEKKYKVSFELRTNLQDGTTIKSECNEIGFKNTGTSTVWINNVYPIFPNEPFSPGGNWNEMDTTVYNFKFLPVSGLTNSLVIIRKIYEK